MAAIDLTTLEATAASKLDPTVYASLRMGARDSVSANRAAWDAARLRPRMLRDVTAVSLNAVDTPMHQTLAGVWHFLADEPSVRAIVVTGRGRAFSAGTLAVALAAGEVDIYPYGWPPNRST
jgi:hypothetical protein